MNLLIIIKVYIIQLKVRDKSHHRLDDEKSKAEKNSKSLNSIVKETGRITSRMNSNYAKIYTQSIESNEFSLENVPMTPIYKKTRNLSPIYFPSLNRNNLNTPATANIVNPNSGLESDLGKFNDKSHIDSYKLNKNNINESNRSNRLQSILNIFNFKFNFCLNWML